MDISTQSNILGKNWFPNFLSSDHVIYFPEATGLINGFDEQDPNVNEYSRMGLGVAGYSYEEQTYQNQPWSMAVEYQEALNRFQAILTNQNPNDVESEVSGTDMVQVGGEIGLTDDVDIVINQVDRANEKYVKSITIFNSERNKKPVSIPMEGSSSVALSGVAKRLFITNKPACIEGFGHKLTVAEQAVPDDTVLVGAGCLWLRRDPAALTGTPRKARYNGGTPIGTGVIGSVSANSRYTAIIAYETTKDGYEDIAWTTVDGAEAASPSLVTDAAAEAAVDALASGARWCIVTQVLVDEVGAVVINTADINKQALPSNTFTFYNTAIAIPAKLQEDSWYLFTYAGAIKIDGAHKRNTNNISSQTSTTIVFSSSTTTMVEVVYWTEPMTKWNQLAA